MKNWSGHGNRLGCVRCRRGRRKRGVLLRTEGKAKRRIRMAAKELQQRVGTHGRRLATK